MRIDDLSVLGWNHTFLCALALIVGALQWRGEKGTPGHAVRGNVYFLSMVAANITALFIFGGEDLLFRHGRPPVIGTGFGFVHWLAVAALALTLLGRLAASLQRIGFFAYAHPICMILSYWLLVGGAVNEAFVRIDWVRRAALAISPGARSIAGYKLLYLVYFALDVAILALLLTAIVQVRRFRRQSA
jgi:uncharacterized membrane protein